MVQEDQILGCSYSGGGGGGGSGGGGGGGGGGSGCSGGGSSRSKKIKQKKVPQRGLGVAQLEKIRLEEQQKKQSLQAANILAKNAIGSSSISNNPPFLGVRPSISPFHTLTPPSSTTANLPSPNAPYKPVSSIDIRQENPGQIPGKLDSSGGEMDFRTGNGNWPKLWNGEYNLGEERKGMDHHGFAFETNPAILPLPIVPHRSHQFQRPSSSSSSSMVNSSSGISPPSELSSQMEPPSNQNFRGNTYSPLWTEEDKMVGMKRSYPFSLESQPAPSLHSSFHRSYAASISKSDELASPSNGYTAFTEPRNKCIREGPSNFRPPPERNPNQTNRDKGRLNGDFLTLAPPSVASPPLDSKHKHHLDYSGHLRHELSEYEIISSQEYAKSLIHEPGPSESVEQPFSFFPIKLPTDQCNNGEKGETIDLNLKL